jgi:hypothetical protein
VTASQILADLLRRGLRVDLADGRIRVRPGSALEPEDFTRIHARRSELIAILAEPELEVSRIAARDIDLPLPCGSCGEARTVMMLMAPGADGEPWALCAGCWR